MFALCCCEYPFFEANTVSSTADSVLAARFIFTAIKGLCSHIVNEDAVCSEVWSLLFPVQLKKQTNSHPACARITLSLWQQNILSFTNNFKKLGYISTVKQAVVMHCYFTAAVFQLSIKVPFLKNWAHFKQMFFLVIFKVPTLQHANVSLINYNI